MLHGLHQVTATAVLIKFRHFIWSSHPSPSFGANNIFMEILENIILAPYTTFKIGGPARYFCVVTNEEDVAEATKFAKKKRVSIMVIGGGSNLLISDKGFRGLVMKNEIKGVEWKDEGDTVKITAGAGEDWEELVKQSVEKGLYGMEHLSSIPGTVGATPIQNIGAYGVDASSIIESVKAMDISASKFVTLDNASCKFGYRDSVFKHDKGKYIVTSVTYRVKKHGKAEIGYKDVAEYFKKRDIREPTLAQVRQAVIEIRKNKLPDWKMWGTAGSFFKNPIVSAQEFQKLEKRFPGLPGYIENDGRVKVALGWILDKVCNVRGLVIGNVGTYEKQALVVVVKPGATASEVVAFARHLMECVKEKTGLVIESEVEWAVA